MMETWKLFGNGPITLPKLMGRNSCFSNITADVISTLHLVNGLLNAPDQQTAKSSAFIEVLTPADDH